MTPLTHVDVPRLPIARLEPVIGPERLTDLLDEANRIRKLLAGRTVWNINSTAVGGGVAEMLHALVGYVEDLDIDIRWMVISGDTEFFAVTKRLHNRIHGQPGDGGPLGAPEAAHYEKVLATHAGALTEHIRPGDLVLLHDPQTAGLTASLVGRGARVVWRCHIGADAQNDLTANAWEFLHPYLTRADGYVFSRQQHVPPWAPRSATWIIPPSIDPFSAKNQDLDERTVRAILGRIGILADIDAGVPASFTRRDGCRAEWRGLPSVARRRVMLANLPLDDVDENAAMVNALQRHATVIVQKSLAEGFGLTVAEGMWKGRPVVGSAVGGIGDQLTRDTGVLLPDPTDLAAFGKAVRELLDNPETAERLGDAARDHVRDQYVGDRHLLRYAQLFHTLIDGR